MSDNIEGRDAVVALSGGQDSTTCLAWAIDRWGLEHIHVVTFDYGQRHRVELECAEAIRDHFDIPDKRALLLPVPAFGVLGAAALTNPDIRVVADASAEHGTGNEHAERAGLPSTFVPGRNLIFLGLVAAYAAQHDIPHIVTGVCEADDAGYPDCRASFIESMAITCRLAMGRDDLRIHAPLVGIDKAGTFALADRLGVLDLVVNGTHTCYEGNHEDLHEWGYGCGECPACGERRSGFEQFVTARGATTVVG